MRNRILQILFGLTGTLSCFGQSDSIRLSTDGNFALIERNYLDCKWWELHSEDKSKKQDYILFYADTVFLVGYSDSLKDKVHFDTVCDSRWRIKKKILKPMFDKEYKIALKTSKQELKLRLSIDSSRSYYVIKKDYYIDSTLYTDLIVSTSIDDKIVFRDTVSTNLPQSAKHEILNFPELSCFISSDNKYMLISGSYRYYNAISSDPYSGTMDKWSQWRIIINAR